MFKKIDHIGLIVKDAEATATQFAESYGFHKLDRPPYIDSNGGFKSIFIASGEITFELITPTDPGNALAKFLEKRGEGFHHISIEVDAIDKELGSLKTKNVRLINEAPDVVEDNKIAFIHPSSTKGVLVEITEKAPTSL